MHKQHTMYVPLVYASGVHGRAEHCALWVKNIENGQKQPKMRTLMVGANVAHFLLGSEYAPNLESTPLCSTYLSGVDQTFLDLRIVGSQVNP